MSSLLSSAMASTKMELINDNPMMPPPHNKRQKYKRDIFPINGDVAAAIVSGISYHPSNVKILNTV